jgi:hypothetical protein
MRYNLRLTSSRQVSALKQFNDVYEKIRETEIDYTEMMFLGPCNGNYDTREKIYDVITTLKRLISQLGEHFNVIDSNPIFSYKTKYETVDKYKSIIGLLERIEIVTGKLGQIDIIFRLIDNAIRFGETKQWTKFETLHTLICDELLGFEVKNYTTIRDPKIQHLNEYSYKCSHK